MIPRWDERRDALPFLTPHAASLAGAVRRGEPRRIRLRRSRCRFFLTFARFSRPRYRLERATSDELPRRSSLVAIDLHGSEDRAKDVSSAGPRDGSSILRPVHAWRCAHADNVPFLGDLGTSDVVGRAAGRGGAPLPTDEPT